MSFHWFHAHREGMSTFERVAGAVVNGMGTPQFLMIQSLVIMTWVAVNVAHDPYHFDIYPFILLNLGLSLQAAYAGPLLSVAARHSEERQRLQADADHEGIKLIRADLDDLHKKVDQLLERSDTTA